MRHPVFRLRDLTFALAFAVAAPMLATGPAAASAGYGRLIVNPGTVAPGRSVSILGTCPVNGARLTGVHSSAFVGGSAPISKTQINFGGSATISPSASGSYTVSAACGPGSPSVTITVSDSRTVAEPSTLTAPASSAAAAAPTSDGPVTSTGLVRVGLAGSTQSTMTSMRVPAVLAVAASALGALGFLRFHRRRATARNTHS